MTPKKHTIAIDFDGTIAETDFPHILALKPNAKEVINTLHEEGHCIIINTCRINKPLEMMKNYLTEKGIQYDYINENNPERIQKYGGDTRKISADYYLDDRNYPPTEINWKEFYNYIKQEEKA